MKPAPGLRGWRSFGLAPHNRRYDGTSHREADHACDLPRRSRSVRERRRKRKTSNGQNSGRATKYLVLVPANLHRSPLFLWRRFQERRFKDAVERGFRIVRDEEPFFLGAALLRLHGFTRRGLRHGSSHHGIKGKCPRRGSDPDDLERSPACKAGLSASSSTGAHGLFPRK